MWAEQVLQNMADPALSDFVDSFLSDPLDFHTKHADPFQLDSHDFHQSLNEAVSHHPNPPPHPSHCTPSILR